VADVHDVEVVKKIKQNEVEPRERNTVLRGTKANVRKDLCPAVRSGVPGGVVDTAASFEKPSTTGYLTTE